MINALQLYSDISSRDRQLAGQDQDRDIRNNLMRYELAFKQDSALREREKMNMLRENAQRNFLAQQMGMQSRERMMGDRMRMQERMGRDKMNQPIWDAERGVFVQRPGAMGQPGMGGMGGAQGGVITPPGLPPRLNKEAQKMQAKAAFELPTALEQGQMAIQQIDEMIGSEDGKIKPHAGFQNAVGMPNVVTGLGARVVPGMFPGSDTASFIKRLKQIQGGAFLQAFEALKGGGQITEVEGKKATEAITRLDQAQSEKEFTTAARELQGIIRRGMENARKQAGGMAPSAPTNAGGWSVVR